MKLAIMQPYLFPYIGYFQLISSADKFVFYDDVNFIKNGWINRNRIIVSGSAKYITVPLRDASSFLKINRVHFIDDSKKILKTIEQSYKKAPYFDQIWPIVVSSFQYRTDLISELAIQSIRAVCAYLGIDKEFEISSEKYSRTQDLTGPRRIIEICRINSATDYNNPIGGVNLYNKDEFRQSGIELHFIKRKEIVYKQSIQGFIPDLSIIDVLMFNSKETVINYLGQFEVL